MDAPLWESKSFKTPGKLALKIRIIRSDSRIKIDCFNLIGHFDFVRQIGQ